MRGTPTSLDIRNASLATSKEVAASILSMDLSLIGDRPLFMSMSGGGHGVGSGVLRQPSICGDSEKESFSLQLGAGSLDRQKPVHGPQFSTSSGQSQQPAPCNPKNTTSTQSLGPRSQAPELRITLNPKPRSPQSPQNPQTQHPYRTLIYTCRTPF